MSRRNRGKPIHTIPEVEETLHIESMIYQSEVVGTWRNILYFIGLRFILMSIRKNVT